METEDRDISAIVLQDATLVIGAGVLRVLLGDTLAPLMGWPPASTLRTIGLVLALYGAGLARQSRATPRDRRLPMMAAAVNAVFAAASVIIPLATGAPLTGAGWAVIAAAAAVAVGFAAAQVRAARA
jgi:hypothetical protein